MATYKSNDTQISGSAESVFDALSNPENLKQLLANAPLDQIPEDKRELLDQIEVTSNSISFPAGPIGSLTLTIDRLERPTLIELVGSGAPVKLSLSLHLRPLTDMTCEGRVEIDIDIPMMLRPMVSGPLQQLVDQFAQALGSIPFNSAV
ncbi:MAG: SRPBCC family protein [Bacteroidales bacterium]|nr:SRPBCC family protein [Bacteroidales bacterium]